MAYSAVNEVLGYVTKNRAVFFANEPQLKAYNHFVEDRSDWEQGNDLSEPPVMGRWGGRGSP